MTCEMRSADLQVILATVAEQAKRHGRLRLYIRQDAHGGFSVTMSSVDGEEPAQSAT